MTPTRNPFLCWLAITAGIALPTAIQEARAQSCVLTETEKLVAPDAQPLDHLGQSVSILGNRLVAGAPGDDDACPSSSACESGAAYVYNLDGSSWTLEDKLTEGASWRYHYGKAVSTGDDRVLVGFEYSQDISRPDPPLVFERDGSPLFCEINTDCVPAGNNCVANFCVGSTWSVEDQLDGTNASTRYGSALDLNGTVAIVGDWAGSIPPGPAGGKAHVFQRVGATWVELPAFTAADLASGDLFGVAVGISGDWAISGAPGQGGNDLGSVYLFHRDDGGTPADLIDDFWAQRQKIQQPGATGEAYFGRAVALDGTTAVVGAPYADNPALNSGTAHVYRYTGTDWVPDGPTLTGSGAAFQANFGFSVAVSGDRLLVGAPGIISGADTGAAYVFQRYDSSYACVSDQECADIGLATCTGNTCEGVVWAEVAQLLASDGGEGDRFGESVSISGDWAAVGAEENDESMGAAYVFDIEDPCPLCGNGELDSGEQCDAGAGNSDTAPDACRTDCTPASCGDGVIDSDEECDDGPDNSDTMADACRTDCTAAICGDGVLDSNEECDDGPDNSDTVEGACRTDCTEDTIAENIDPDSDESRYAYAENVGWLNAEPLGDGGPGVRVGDSGLTGYMWGENVGWIGLSCENTASCATESYGVQNDGCGELTGYAWAENVGWISFSCLNTASCATADYGVTIDPQTGGFSGRAWGENVGWITFASSGPNPYGVKTSWRASPPTGSPTFTGLEKVGENLTLQWSSVSGAEFFDVVSGSLNDLASSQGDFSVAVDDCTSDVGETSFTLPLLLGSDADFYLVRGVNCGGEGTVNSGGSGQVGLRDDEVAASPNDCP